MEAAVKQSHLLFPLLAVVLVVALAAVRPTGVDQSVLMTWAERFIDGERPFIDFIEINPIGSLLLYVPSVLLGRWTGMGSEAATVVVMLTLIAVSLALCARIAKIAGVLTDHQRPTLLASAIVILGAMPAAAFAQREHVGIVALIPLLFVVSSEAQGPSRLPTWLRLAAGALAGLSLVAKPHLALLVLGALAFSALRQRRLRHTWGAQWIAATLVVSAYLSYSWIAHPAFYTAALPRIADVYLGWRLGFDRMLFNPLVPIIGLCVVVLMRTHENRPLAPATWLLALTALLASAIFFIQGRGWPYHALPALTAAALALAFEVTRTAPRASTQSRMTAAIPVAALILVSFAWCFKDHDRDVAEIARRITALHPRPSLVAIAEDISVGHPLVRQVAGHWAQRVTHLWTAGGVIRQLTSETPPSSERRARLLAHMEAELSELAVAIDDGRPDLVLAQVGKPEKGEFDWLAWARSDPRLARSLEHYATVGRIGDIEILKRQSGE